MYPLARGCSARLEPTRMSTSLISFSLLQPLQGTNTAQNKTNHNSRFHARPRHSVATPTPAQAPTRPQAHVTGVPTYREKHLPTAVAAITVFATTNVVTQRLKPQLVTAAAHLLDVEPEPTEVQTKTAATPRHPPAQTKPLGSTSTPVSRDLQPRYRIPVQVISRRSEQL